MSERFKVPRGRRNRWLYWLGRAAARRDPSPFVAELHQLLTRELVAGGMDGLTASKVALRTVKLAALLLAGVQQREAARRLNVCERTAKYDAQRLRRLVESGALWRSIP